MLELSVEGWFVQTCENNGINCIRNEVIDHRGDAFRLSIIRPVEGTRKRPQLALQKESTNHFTNFLLNLVLYNRQTQYFKNVRAGGFCKIIIHTSWAIPKGVAILAS